MNKPINLALQGGGAHGAFTWGVLDALLEDQRVDIHAISGASAGAVNAVAVADGLVRGGRDGARERLATLWRTISRVGQVTPIRRSLWNQWRGDWSLDNSVTYRFFDMLTRMLSPNEFNVFDVNLLRDVVSGQIDFDRVACCSDIQLYLSATHVRTGRVRVFGREEITLDVVLASACLPRLFKTVMVDEEPYWDGGFMGNPPLHPFVYHCTARDVVLVQINPFERREIPRSAIDIENRINEITFNSSLMGELRAIDFVTRLIDAGKLDASEYKRMYMHLISAEEQLEPLRASSKFNTEWRFLEHLFNIGRQSATEWLERHYDKLGERSSVHIRSLFAGEDGPDASQNASPNAT
ncbi:MAG: patatin-like phospholipase family protein [Myxococcota bacterium]